MIKWGWDSLVAVPWLESCSICAKACCQGSVFEEAHEGRMQCYFPCIWWSWHSLTTTRCIIVASCQSQKVLGQGKWNFKKQFDIGHTANEVLEVMQHMAKNDIKVNENLTFLTIKSIHAITKVLKISRIPQLNSTAIQELASPLMGWCWAAVALGEEYSIHVLCLTNKVPLWP